MGINIDKFLDSFLEGEDPIEEKDLVEEKKVINLSFEQDVEKKLSALQKQVEPSNNSLSFLEEAFKEIKTFDETLPNKFIGIDTQAEITLKLLGDKYSQSLYIQSQQQLELVKQLIQNHIKESEEYKNSQNLVEALKSLDKSFNLFSKIPDTFLEEKQEISQLIKEKELFLLQELKSFKNNKLQELKSELNKRILSMNKKLIPGNFLEIKQEFEDLKIFYHSFPKIYLSDLFQEKEVLLKFSLKVENYLRDEYLREFDQKEKIINSLTEEFLSNNIQKNFNQALLIYNQILVEFDTLPNVFFERKVQIFKKVNDLYSTLSKLIIKNNVSLFVDSYNFSKIIEETREYLRHVKISKNFSKATLETLLEKLNTIPNNLSDEVDKYKKIINNILNQQNNHNSDDINSLENSQENNLKKNNQYENRNSNTEKLHKKRPEHFEFEKIKENKPEEKNEKINKTPKVDSILRKPHIKEKNLQNKIQHEINSLYKLFQTSQDKEQLKIIYKKLLFYIGVLEISKEEKEKLISKIKNSLNKKRL